MNRSGLQRLIPIILVLIVVGLAITALVSVSRTFFGGSKSPSSTAKPAVHVNVGKQALTNTSSTSSITMNVRGPLVSDENFHSYTIAVSPGARDMTTYQGYADNQVEDDRLSNTTQGYEQFVYALSRAKLMNGMPLSGSANDERGVCATGYVYEFEVLQSGSNIQKLWTSTCAGSPGSLKANLTQVTNLFQVQIPDFAARLQKINLNG